MNGKGSTYRPVDRTKYEQNYERIFGMRQPEHHEQAALIRWANAQAGAIPELALLFAIPNGGHRHKAVAGKMRAEGVKSGVPDLFLPARRGGHAGLFIEMKAGKNRPTAAQTEWQQALRLQGFASEVCYGFDEARETILAYLDGQQLKEAA